MKTPIYFFLLAIFFFACSDNCDPVLNTCTDIPPTNEACLAYFERWFYNSETNECEQMGYSGCSEWGFESEEACQECQCD